MEDPNTMDYQNILDGSEELVKALIKFLSSGVAVCLGSYFIFSGLQKMIEHSKGLRQGQPTAGPIAINLLIGSLMVQLSFTIDTLVETIFGGEKESPSEAMRYLPAQAADSKMMQTLVNAGVWWVAFIGVTAIMRGLILWNDLSKGRGAGESLGRTGFWHIVFGALCCNFPGLLGWLSGN